MKKTVFLYGFAAACMLCSPVANAQESGSGSPQDSTQDSAPTASQGAEHESPEASSPEGKSGGRPPSVFSGDWVTIGVGVGMGPSYDGSNDYNVSPAPVVQGQVAGVRISARPAGLAADVIPDDDGRISYSFGPTFRLRNDRASRIDDEVVKLAGELDRAFEVGVTGAIGVSDVLQRRDNLSLEVDVRWDVAGAHNGRVIAPAITYFAPINRGIAANFSVGMQFVDDDFADFYYSVNAEQSAASGLTPFLAEGGLNSIGGNALLIIDLDGNIANGGFSGVVITGYSRLQGDAADTPYTSVRGDPNQFFAALGIGYTF